MNNEKQPKGGVMEQRLDLRHRLDNAMAAGKLTIEVLMQIPPTATSIEHHITLMNRLKAERKVQPPEPSVEAQAYMASQESLLEQIYANETQDGQLAA